MALAAGYDSIFAVSEIGQLFAFGDNINSHFEINLPNTNNKRKLVTGLPAPVRQVAVGYKHIGIVTDAGDLFMCGRGDDGQLGLGDTVEDSVNWAMPTPTLVPRFRFNKTAVLMVACGLEHTVVLTVDGVVYTFGRGIDGQLGHGDEDDKLVPQAVFTPHGLDERVVMVAAGEWHTVALNEAGHVLTWGSNDKGQLGHSNNKGQLTPRQVGPGRFLEGDNVVFVAAGGRHTVAVTGGGQLYTWGNNFTGQLGHGNFVNRLEPTLVKKGMFGVPQSFTVVMAACGHAHTLVVTHDGGLWACGRGDYGQLGLNDRVDKVAFRRVGDTTGAAFGGARVVAAAAGYCCSAALTEDGALWTWGCSERRNLSHGGERNYLVPTKVAGAGLGGGRMGRCWRLPVEHTVALVMGLNERLGGGREAVYGTRRSSRLQGKRSSPIFDLNEEVVQMIASMSGVWPTGRAGTQEGIARLLGEGLPAPDLQATTVQKMGDIAPALGRVKVCQPCKNFLSI